MLKTKDKTVGFVEESRGTGHDRMQFSLPLDLVCFFFSLWFQWCKAAASFFIPKQTAVYRGLLHLEAETLRVFRGKIKVTSNRRTLPMISPRSTKKLIQQFAFQVVK